jgi:hypothetical protein
VPQPGPVDRLDTSAAFGAVPDELQALRSEPLVAVDRVQLARAALAALSFAEARELYLEWIETLPAEERACL